MVLCGYQGMQMQQFVLFPRNILPLLRITPKKKEEDGDNVAWLDTLYCQLEDPYLLHIGLPWNNACFHEFSNLIYFLTKLTLHANSPHNLIV